MTPFGPEERKIVEKYLADWDTTIFPDPAELAICALLASHDRAVERMKLMVAHHTITHADCVYAALSVDRAGAASGQNNADKA